MKDVLLILLFGIWSMIWYAAGEWTSKLWADKPSWLMYIAVLVTYDIGIIGWLLALRQHGQLSAMTTIWACATLINGVLVGILVFGEVLTIQQLIGVILALAATALVF